MIHPGLSRKQTLNGSARQRAAGRLSVALLALILATFAQRRLDGGKVDGLSIALYILAAVLFALAAGSRITVRQPPGRGERAASALNRRSLPVIAVLLGLSLAGCLDFGRNRFRLAGFVLWVGGLGLCWLYLQVAERPGPLGRQVHRWLAQRRVAISWTGLALAAAMLVGAVLRLYQLESIPGDIGWDLPYNFTDALSILNGEYRVFFPANQGREGLFMYLIAWVARFAPLSHFSIKLTSALVGILTIPAIYLLGRELFDPAVGLVSAALLAVNHWHLVLSRAGFRVILLPLFVVLLLYTVSRALRTGVAPDFALAGLVLGFGLYTYTAYLFAVVAVYGGFLIQPLLRRGMAWRRLLPLILLMTAVALVAYGPLLRYALENPTQYLQRVGLQRRLLLEDPNRPSMTAARLLENIRTSLLMFHVYGDHNVRFNVPFLRHFGVISAILLPLGLACGVRAWRRGQTALLVVALFALIVPMTLAMFPNEMPNVFRAAGTIGPGLLLGALAAVVLYRSARELALAFPAFDLRVRLRVSSAAAAQEFLASIGRRTLCHALALVLVGVLLLAEFRDTRQFYFHDFVGVLPDRQNVSIAKEMARQIQAYGDLEACYIKVWPHWFDGRALQTYLRRPYDNVWQPEFAEWLPQGPPLSTMGDHALFILHPDDTDGLAALRQLFPRHASIMHYLPDNAPAFVTVQVER